MQGVLRSLKLLFSFRPRCIPVSIPEDIAADVLSRCARRCCLCRRFLPIRLQVHHIVEQSKGGTNDYDNLISLCLTCHTDVHTKAPFTRRFTVAELKAHRDAVYKMVAEGKFSNDSQNIEVSIEAALARFDQVGSCHAQVRLERAAREILVKAAAIDGLVTCLSDMGSTDIQAGGELLNNPTDRRSIAEFIAGIEQLESLGLVRDREYSGEAFDVTHEGYLLADQILADGAASTEESSG